MQTAICPLGAPARADTRLRYAERARTDGAPRDIPNVILLGRIVGMQGRYSTEKVRTPPEQAGGARRRREGALAKKNHIKLELKIDVRL